MKHKLFSSRALLAAMLVFCLFLASCDKLKTVTSSVKRAIPLLQAEGISVKNADEVLRLITLFDADPQAATLDALTLAFDGLTADAREIANPTKRTVVLVVLVGANIALQAMAEEYIKKVSVTAAMSVGAQDNNLRGFASREKWQCRSSQTGRYVPMSYCKEHPDVSTVESR
jgi:hypothetical protein